MSRVCCRDTALPSHPAHSIEFRFAYIFRSLKSLFCSECVGANQIFYYIRSTTPKRITSWWGPSSRPAQLLRTISNTLSDLTGPRFEPPTSRSRDSALLLEQLADALITPMIYSVGLSVIYYNAPLIYSAWESSFYCKLVFFVWNGLN